MGSPSLRLGIVCLALIALALAPVAAAAEACPGSGAGACPYTLVQIIGQRAEGVLRFPEAVAVDASGDVYVADQLSYVVQKFSAEGTFETEWGSYGGGHGQFGPIGGLAVDATGDVYVVDSSHDRIEKFGPNGEYIMDWGSRGSAVGQFNFGSSQNPSQPPGGGIAVTGDHVYVADSGNDRIERFDLEGGEPIAWGSLGSGPGQFSYPRGVAASESEVIVTDDDNHRVEQFTPEGAFENEFGSQGVGTNEFGFPYGVALDAAGDVYVADDSNHRVVKLTPQLTWAGAWGGLGSKPGELDFPRALAADPAGDTYVADTANERIEVFGPTGAYLRTFGTPARGPGLLTAPRGVAVDPTGRLLVSDTVDDRIEAFAPGTYAFSQQWTITPGSPSPAGATSYAGLSQPSGIAVDPRGAVFVADEDNARVARLWGEGSFLGELGGPGDVGGAGLDGADAIAVGGQYDQTYVADAVHNRVLVYSSAGGLLAKFGADGGNGAAGGGAAGFNHPDGIALAPSGNLYVADTANNRVVELSPGGAFIAAWGSKGASAGRFNAPTSLAVDGDGDVYVLDSENNRVQEFTASGQLLARWGMRGTGPGEFSQPKALAIGCEGDVYVADTNNDRVERFTPAAPAGAGCLASPASWPPLLNVTPVVEVDLARARGVLARRALVLSVDCRLGCQRGGRILVTGTLAPFHRRAVALVGAARAVAGGQPTRVKLAVGPLARHRLRAELGRRRGIAASLTIVVEGSGGARTTVSRSFLVTR
jgi:sugar lactone lactonase YvrE